MGARGVQTIKRKRLGVEMRRLRENAGVSMHDAALLIDRTDATVSNLENGKSATGRSDLAALLTAYGATDEVIAALEDVRKDASQRGWWSMYGLPEWLKPYVSLETDAVSARNAEPGLVIPGLLQTEDYARQICESGRQGSSPENVPSWVAARMKRQQRLFDPQPLELWAIMSEVSLRIPVGAPWVMAQQCARILELAKLPNVKVQVLPMSIGAHGAMTGGFNLLSFPEPEDADVGFLDQAISGQLVDDPGFVIKLGTLFDDLRDVAMSTRDSIRLIDEIMAEWNRHGD